MGAARRGDLERYLHELAERRGWRRHDRSGRTWTGHADGFPHEVLLRRGRLLVVFLLSPTGELISPERAWLHGLATARSLETHVFRPGDLAAVERVLSTDEEPVA